MGLMILIILIILTMLIILMILIILTILILSIHRWSSPSPRCTSSSWTQGWVLSWNNGTCWICILINICWDKKEASAINIVFTFQPFLELENIKVEEMLEKKTWDIISPREKAFWDENVYLSGENSQQSAGYLPFCLFPGQNKVIIDNLLRIWYEIIATHSFCWK